MNKGSAVVLLSGGLDSAVASAYLKHNNYSIKAGVFINRGQSNYERELAAVRNVAEYLKIPLLYADFSLPDLGQGIVPKGARKMLGIPARNLILGAVALPYVYTLDCQFLAFGNIVSDYFPDCNQKFRFKFAEAASQALNKRIEVVAPLADWERWDKADEISFAEQTGYSVLFRLTWTCWSGGEFHCGNCHACEGRKEGFASAGITDPTIYDGVQQ